MPWNNGGQGPWGTPPGGSQGGSPGGSGGNGQGNNQRPGGPRGPKSPWGGGGGGGQMPDVDELIARAQAWVRGLLPGGGGGGGGPKLGGSLGGSRGIALLGIAVVALWLATGFYRVQPDQQGVVLRFGALERKTLPGLNWHIPWPVESVLRPAVTRINRVEVGYRSAVVDPRIVASQDRPIREVPEESLMLTGDENIVDINFAVFWRINDAAAFLFNIRDPELTIKSVAESVMREVIARTPIQLALTERRAQIEQDVNRITQGILSQYKAGVEVTQVQLQKVDPPAAVVESFRDVQRANTDAERLRNEAESYRNDIVPRARGDAARITAEAEGARQASIAEATGQAQRFESVLTAYTAAKEVTLQRMYIDTMQDVMSHTPTVVVDDNVKNLVPFLPLNDLAAPRPAAPVTGGAPPQAPPPPQSLSAPPRITR